MQEETYFDSSGSSSSDDEEIASIIGTAISTGTSPPTSTPPSSSSLHHHEQQLVYNKHHHHSHHNNVNVIEDDDENEDEEEDDDRMENDEINEGEMMHENNDVVDNQLFLSQLLTVYSHHQRILNQIQMKTVMERSEDQREEELWNMEQKYLLRRLEKLERKNELYRERYRSMGGGKRRGYTMVLNDGNDGDGDDNDRYRIGGVANERLNDQVVSDVEEEEEQVDKTVREESNVDDNMTINDLSSRNRVHATRERSVSRKDNSGRISATRGGVSSRAMVEDATDNMINNSKSTELNTGATSTSMTIEREDNRKRKRSMNELETSEKVRDDSVLTIPMPSDDEEEQRSTKKSKSSLGPLSSSADNVNKAAKQQVSYSIFDKFKTSNKPKASSSKTTSDKVQPPVRNRDQRKRQLPIPKIISTQMISSPPNASTTPNKNQTDTLSKDNRKKKLLLGKSRHEESKTQGQQKLKLSASSTTKIVDLTSSRTGLPSAKYNTPNEKRSALPASSSSSRTKPNTSVNDDIDYYLFMASEESQRQLVQATRRNADTTTSLGKKSSNASSSTDSRNSKSRTEQDSTSKQKSVCVECKVFYDSLQGLPEAQRLRMVNSCSRHQPRHERPSTPDNYWALEIMPDTQQQQQQLTTNEQRSLGEKSKEGSLAF